MTRPAKKKRPAPQSAEAIELAQLVKQFAISQFYAAGSVDDYTMKMAVLSRRILGESEEERGR